MNNIGEIFDWRTILVDQYKQLGISEGELAIILVIHSQKKRGIDLITPDTLALNMAMEFKDVDKSFTNLIKKKLVDFNNKQGKYEVSLEPLKKRLLKMYYESLKDEQQKGEEIYKKDLDDILVLFESEFGRALSKNEVETIEGWFKKGYLTSVIKEALNVAILAKVKTVRYIDKVLLEWQKKEELRKDGRTTIGDKWEKNLKETIEITKVNWLDDEDDD